MKHLASLLLILLFSSVATQITAQKTRRTTLGNWMYVQPKKSTALDTAKIYKFNYVNPQNKEDLSYFNLPGFTKSLSDEGFDFFVELEQFRNNVSKPEVKCISEEVKRKNKTDTTIVSYVVESLVVSSFKMVVMAENFDTLLVSSAKAINKISTKEHKCASDALREYKCLDKPLSKTTKSACSKLMKKFDLNFKEQYKTIPFKVYLSKEKEFPLYQKGYSNLQATYNLLKSAKYASAENYAEESEFYFKACLNELPNLQISETRKVKLEYAVHVNLAQLYLLKHDFTSMYMHLEQAFGLNYYPKAYEKRLYKIAYKCAGRLDFKTLDGVLYE